MRYINRENNIARPLLHVCDVANDYEWHYDVVDQRLISINACGLQDDYCFNYLYDNKMRMVFLKSEFDLNICRDNYEQFVHFIKLVNSLQADHYLQVKDDVCSLVLEIERSSFNKDCVITLTDYLIDLSDSYYPILSKISWDKMKATEALLLIHSIGHTV